MSLIGFCANIINIPIQAYVIGLLLLALVVSCIVVLILKNILLKYVEKNNKKLECIALIIAFITVFNFMYIENLYFVEAFVMSISLLAYVIAAKEIVYHRSIVKAILYTVLGIFCYQGTIGVLFTMTFLFSILENKKINKDTIKNVIVCIIAAALSILLNLVVIKIVGQILNLNQVRLQNAGIINNIKIIFLLGGKIITKCCEMFPEYLLIWFALVITLIFCIYILKYKKKENMLLDYFAIMLITIGSAFATYILSTTAFYAGRLKFTLGALIGILYIYIYCRTDILTQKTILKKISIIILVIYFLFNIFNYENLMLQHKLVNKMEKEEVISIDEEIEEYEETTNKKVEKLAIIYMTHYNENIFYNGISNKCVLTYSALKCDWSITGAIYYYSGRKLSSYSISEEEYTSILENNNLEDDVVVFIDDTIYMKIYIY